MSNQLELALECKKEQHIWGPWISTSHYTQVSNCTICKESRYLVPKPSPLPTRSRFSVFLADWKASRRRDR